MRDNTVTILILRHDIFIRKGLRLGCSFLLPVRTKERSSRSSQLTSPYVETAMNIIEAIIFFIVGLILIVGSKRLGRDAYEKRWTYDFMFRTQRRATWIYIVLGIFCICIAIIGLLG